MTLSLTLTAVDDTDAVFAITGRQDGTIEFQIATRPDFDFCLSPLCSVASADTLVMQGLNAGATYYMRARNRLTDGSLPDGWTATTGFTTTGAPALVGSTTGIVVAPTMVVLPVPILSIASNPAPAAGYPLSNLLRDSPVTAQIPGVTAAGVTLTIFTGGAYVDTLALLGTNLPEFCSWQVYAANSQDGLASPAWYNFQQQFRATSGLPQRDSYHGVMDLAASGLKNFRYPWWRITLFNPQVPAGLLALSYLVMGQNLATKNFSTSSSETGVDLGSLDRTRAGAPDRQRGGKMRKIEFDIVQLTEQQHETKLARLSYHQNDPVLVVPNSQRGAFFHDRIAYGALSTTKHTKTSSLRFTRSFAIDSLI